MKPLQFGSKARTPLEAKIVGSKGAVLATVMPRGPLLKLEPVMDRIMITSADEGREEGKIGDIHLPGNLTSTFNAYAEVKVLAVGPDVKSLNEGDRVLVVRPQCQKVVHDGNEYWWTTEASVMGIIR